MLTISPMDDKNEIAALATVAARYGGIFVPHGRSTGVNVVNALDEPGKAIGPSRLRYLN